MDNKPFFSNYGMAKFRGFTKPSFRYANFRVDGAVRGRTEKSWREDFVLNMLKLYP